MHGWAKHLSGIYKVEKERLLTLIQSLDVKAETTVLPASELHAKLDAEMRLKELLREEELKWALSVSKPADLGRGSRTMRLRLMVTGGGGHNFYPGSGPLYGGNTLLPT